MSAPVRDERTGAWVYPEGWSAAQREAWEGAVNEQTHHEKEAERLAAAGAALLTSADMVLAQQRVNVAAAKAKRDRAERIAKGEAAWIHARLAHGERCARLDGEEGDVIIMVTPEESAITQANRRADDIMAAALATIKPGATEEEQLRVKRRALDDSLAAMTDALLLHTVIGGIDANASAARLHALMAAYAGLRPMLMALRDQMIRGWRDAEGKGYAP